MSRDLTDAMASSGQRGEGKRGAGRRHQGLPLGVGAVLWLGPREPGKRVSQVKRHGGRDGPALEGGRRAPSLPLAHREATKEQGRDAWCMLAEKLFSAHPFASPSPSLCTQTDGIQKAACHFLLSGDIMVAFSGTFSPDAFSMVGSGEGLGGPANMASAALERPGPLPRPGT